MGLKGTYLVSAWQLAYTQFFFIYNKLAMREGAFRLYQLYYIFGVPPLSVWCHQRFI
jgi:hypothetical protein